MSFFSLLAAAVNVYTLMCFIRIMLTWVPSLAYSKFGRIMSEICDPYLNLFRRFRFLTFGHIDFSPVLSIGLLAALSSVFESIAKTGRFSIGVIFATLTGIIWSLISSIATFLFIVFLIRLIFLLIKKDSNSSFWYALDSMINPVIYKLIRVFTPRNKFIRQQTALIIALVALLLIQLLGRLIFSLIISLFLMLPI